MKEPKVEIAQLARAMERAIDEHGSGNAFSLKELRDCSVAPSPQMCGRIGTMWIDRLAAALPDTVVTYSERAFVVSPRPSPKPF